ncbi:hypothetical protein HDU97_000959 [Phlyctochytrium planicorne]|nr:hypothetical protein HDU97_000959 [Phlyctochytrium planicorne]
MKLNTYTVRALQASLGRGVAANSVLSGNIKRIHVGFGNHTCGAVNALKVFAVNELPRIHQNNPSITFITSTEQDKKSFLKLVYGNDTEKLVDISAARTPAVVFQKFAAEVGLDISA